MRLARELSLFNPPSKALGMLQPNTVKSPWTAFGFLAFCSARLNRSWRESLTRRRTASLAAAVTMTNTSVKNVPNTRMGQRCFLRGGVATGAA